MVKFNSLKAMALAASFFTGILAASAVEIRGLTEPYMDVMLGLPDAGIIRTLFSKEGDLVQKGRVILELDNRLEALEVVRRQAIMEQNKRVYESTSNLLEHTKSVSREELSKAEAEYKVSSAERDIARQQLENRQLMAPFTGSISEILLKPGAGCAPYQSLVHFVDTSRAFFTGYIEGAQAAKLTKDEPVQVVLDTGQTVAATIWFISPTVDASSGLVKVKALFDNADLKIRPGLSAKLVVQDK